MKRLFVLAGLAGLILLAQFRAAAQDEQYFRVYTLIQEGDSLKSSEQNAQALSKYLEAQTALQNFQKVNPTWNPKIITYRLNYLASRITEISAKNPLPPTPQVKTNLPPGATPNSDLENQLNLLRQQVGQLQNDKTVLEAKLKEALSAQPALIDPREYTKAMEQIKSLQKENDLMRVNLDRKPAADTRALDQANQQLADANRKLSEQTARASSLSEEKSALQTKLDSLIQASWNTTNISNTRKALDETNRKLAEQTDLATRLDLEKSVLQARVKTLMADSEALAAVRAENELLKKQLAEYKAAPASSSDAVRQLAEAKALVASLQSDKELLRLEKVTLENRVKQLSSTSVSSTSLPPPGAPADAERVKQLERERTDLEKKLDAAQKELYGRNGKEAAAKVEDLNNQLELLRTRMGVIEAQKVPYSPEELALLKKPEPVLADPKAGKKSIKELPPGTAGLVAEAQRDFAARRYDQAEEKYLQVLKQDENNIYTLANLAAIQLELNHLDEAEKHINRAVAAAPDDAYSLSILGYLRFRQQKYNEALDALSKAAKLEPSNAEIQNYLGLTLTQKGLRSAAETAFRKAIVLDPNYASANYNLAVFYLTQKTPEPRLARWHYEKAVAGGLPRNPDLEKMFEQNKPESGE